MGQKDLNVDVLEYRLKELYGSVDQRRISKLSRGSIRAQNGYYINELEWKKLRSEQRDRLARVSEAFYPEKYKA